METNLARGQRVGDRYQLIRELGSGGSSVTWEALDERLGRSVALRVFESSIDRPTLVRRAGVAASLTHPRVVRVFDTGQDGNRFFTVSELLQTSLGTVRLPLAPDAAVQTAIDVAEALQYAHERGVVHGNLHEGNVLLSEGGAKVADFALARLDDNAQRSDDLRSFGTMLTRVSRMPSGAPVGFDRVVEGLANGAYDSAAEALTDLRQLRGARAKPRTPQIRRVWIVLAVAVLIGLAIFGLTRLGERSPGTQFAPGGKIEGNPLTIASADDFDPAALGGDDDENPQGLPRSIDGDPQTFWTTERYSGSADFNGRKPGVGVIFDLGEAREVGQAQVLFHAAGCSFELRYSDEGTAPIDDWNVAATVERSPLSSAIIFEAAEARFWMVWITRLTSTVEGRPPFTCAISEADLFAP
ncbi:MAG: protein kinase [Actinomycetota bacterium]